MAKITLRIEHIKLLQQLDIKLALNNKRPYGSSDLAWDIERIIGSDDAVESDESSENSDKLFALHDELDDAMQVILKYAAEHLEEITQHAQEQTSARHCD